VLVLPIAERLIHLPVSASSGLGVAGTVVVEAVEVSVAVVLVELGNA
jgi:hypothetical protein